MLAERLLAPGDRLELRSFQLKQRIRATKRIRADGNFCSDLKGFPMPGKRSNRKQIQQFCCPYCDRRLWRVGSTKHFLFYTEASEIRQYINVSHKNAALLANQGAYVDRDRWIEEFYCGEHGKTWLKISRNSAGQLTSQVATSKDWQQTTRTINPEMPNPSVSEFSYRMSRPPTGRLSYCTR